MAILIGFTPIYKIKEGALNAYHIRLSHFIHLLTSGTKRESNQLYLTIMDASQEDKLNAMRGYKAYGLPSAKLNNKQYC